MIDCLLFRDRIVLLFTCIPLLCADYFLLQPCPIELGLGFNDGLLGMEELGNNILIMWKVIG